MGFSIPRNFRWPIFNYEANIDLDEILSDFSNQDVLRILADNDKTFAADLAEFIQSDYDGGLDKFYEEHKDK